MKLNIKLPKKGWLAVAVGLTVALTLIIFAYILGLIAIILSFIVIFINLIWGFFLWLAAQLGLAALFGCVITKLTTLLAWFSSTWLGSLLMPIYTWLVPIASKFGPAITMGKWARALWKKVRTLRKKSKKEFDQTSQIIEHQDD